MKFGTAAFIYLLYRVTPLLLFINSLIRFINLFTMTMMPYITSIPLPYHRVPLFLDG